MELARWASWRWAGRVVPFLRAASPPRMVAGIPARAPGRRSPRAVGPVRRGLRPPAAVIRTPPTDDGVALAMAACRLGDALILTPDMRRGRHLAIALRRAGIHVALGPDDWAVAAGGATVIGSRSAAWLPMPELAAVLVFDEHDEAYQEERTPTWHARAGRTGTGSPSRRARGPHVALAVAGGVAHRSAPQTAPGGGTGGLAPRRRHRSPSRRSDARRAVRPPSAGPPRRRAGRLRAEPQGTSPTARLRCLW
ncbi:MAG: hypothetical protein R2695_18205 [Acidimicrobiales bacterium]